MQSRIGNIKKRRRNADIQKSYSVKAIEKRKEWVGRDITRKPFKRTKTTIINKEREEK